MKIRVIASVVCVALAALGSSCAKSGPSPEKAAEPGKAQAAETVKPGSHEDWCEEHGVPESQCTRCNPSLTAAFKATGDWCKEHGVPESQCLKCHPDLKIVRPPKEN
jgi:hypothetical protein